MAISKADMAEIVGAVVAALQTSAPATAAPSTKTRTTRKRRTAAGGDPAATYKAKPSPVRDGFVELFFTAKPTAEVRDALKSKGFRFTINERGACWYGPKANL